MARERKRFTQQEGTPQGDALPCAQTSAVSTVANQAGSTHHKERLHDLIRALARELARADHARED
ncbi:hypothetical protein [Pseudorhodobacter aquimaris]|uniref:hypothetical protein n=1 Tax=Pseudorhodobacter aquimaris TaxID=687412 RepID=UPI000AC6A5E1|nr:hypothetical protein [Pseudorhodobacter aquimaris]